MTEERRKLVEEFDRCADNLDHSETMETWSPIFRREFDEAADKIRAYDAAHSEEVEG